MIVEGKEIEIFRKGKENGREKSNAYLGGKKPFGIQKGPLRDDKKLKGLSRKSARKTSR